MVRRSRERSAALSEGLFFRGEEVRVAQIREIRKLIRRHRKAGRQQITAAVCRAWGWRRSNGELNLGSCRGLLKRLEAKGEIRLPAPRTRPGKRKSPVEKGPLPAGPSPRVLGKDAVAWGEVLVRPIVPAESARWRELMARFHYLGDGVLVGESMRYVAESPAGWLALLGWGTAALKSRHREAYIGWEEKLKLQRLQFITNNARFLILPWVRVPHLASRVLGATLKRLSGDWRARYGHGILLAETFVDLGRFRGTCYRAANWTYLGQTRGMGRSGAGYKAHGQPKGLFVYPLHARARQILAAPFPSPAIMEDRQMSGVSIDVNRLPLDGHGGLIEVLREIHDPRQAQGIRHPFVSVMVLATLAVFPFVSVMVLATLAVLGGMRSYEAIAEWAADLPKDLLKRLRCWCHRAPSEPTFRRVLQSVNADEVDEKIGQWLVQQKGLRDQGVAIDGKTLRGSGDGEKKPWHLLAAIVHGTGVVVAQRSVGEKTNEITVAAPLLEDLNIEGATVTADAMHTQQKFAKFIVEKKKADYVLIAKDNQPTLREDLGALDWGASPPSGKFDRQGPRSDRDPQDLGK